MNKTQFKIHKHNVVVAVDRFLSLFRGIKTGLMIGILLYTGYTYYKAGKIPFWVFHVELLICGIALTFREAIDKISEKLSILFSKTKVG